MKNQNKKVVYVDAMPNIENIPKNEMQNLIDFLEFEIRKYYQQKNDS